MRFWALGLGLGLGGAAAAIALVSCATGSAIDPDAGVMFVNSSSTSSSGTGSGSGSGGSDDATVSGSSSGYGSSASSSSSGSTSSSSGVTDDAGDDGGSSSGVTPGPTCNLGEACVDAVPSGWSGFVQIVFPAGDAGAGCTGGYPVEQTELRGQTNPDGGPATCGACTCLVPDAGATCTVNVFNSNLGCIPANGGAANPLAANQCVAVSGTTGVVSAPQSSGNCAADTVPVTTPPPPPTSTSVTACAVPDGGGPDGGGDGGATCASGQACATVPAGLDGGVASGVCVYQAGVQSCPPSGTSAFTNQFIVGGVEDDRGCGCTCGPVACPADGYVTGYSGTSCAGAASLTVDAGGGTCKAFGISQGSFIYHPSHGSSQGTCGAGTSAPSGSVTIDAGSATTFCCVP